MQTEPERQENGASPDGHPAGVRRAPARGARTWRRIRRIAGGARLIARRLVDTAHPQLVQIVYADIKRAYRTPTGCAPFCTIGCVHRVSIMNFWRDPQTESTVRGAANQRGPAR